MTADDPLSSLRSSRPVDPGFADRLESSLRIQHAARRHTPPVRSRWRQLLLLGPVVVLVVLASAVLVLRDEAQSSALELREAHNVVVTLPDGTSLVDPVGLELVDGAVVTVGPGGRAVIDDVEFGPGAVITVRNRALVTPDPATTTSLAPSGGTDTEASVAPTTDPPAYPTADGRTDVAPGTDRGQAGDRGTDSAPPLTSEPSDRDTADRDSDDFPSYPTDAPARDDAEDAAPIVDAARAGGDDGQHRIVDLALTVRLRDGGVTVRFGATGVDVDGLRVMLLRSRGPDAPEPDWPRVGDVTIAAETSGSQVGEFRDSVPGPRVLLQYRVVALVGDDVVARSAVQTLAPDR